MKVTLKMLERKGACLDQRLNFEAAFGKSVEVSTKLCVKHAQEFNWNWAAYRLLPPALTTIYGRRMRKHEVAYGTARNALRRKMASADGRAERAYYAGKHTVERRKVLYTAQERHFKTYLAAVHSDDHALDVAKARTFGRLAVAFDNSRKAAKKARAS